MNNPLEFFHLSNSELLDQTIALAKSEQQTTLELLKHLHEIEQRKLYAQKGYGSLFEYVMKTLHYSETQTAERISAMRLMFRTEQAKEALEKGTLSLTQAAMTERHLRKQEKEQRIALQPKDIRLLVDQVAGKSKRETEKILLSQQIQEVKVPERMKTVSETESKVEFPVSDQTRQAMERFWELKGKGSISEMFSTCLEFYLEHKDPLKQKIRAPKPTLPVRVERNSRYIPAATKRDLFAQSNGRCEYIDSETYRRCESRYLL